MTFIYAPKHTVEQYTEKATEHQGHRLHADFTNGLGYHKPQDMNLWSVVGGQIYVGNDYGSWWYPVTELWAHGTPQCLSCEVTHG